MDKHGLPMDAIAKLCRAYHVRELSLFGSAVRGESGPDSDLDLLVVFEPHTRVGFMMLAGLQRELSALMNRSVDLVPKEGLKPLIREEILAESEVLFAA
ncbi:MAG: nucleotidyltransferase family protein [Phycisphaerae bacterium]